MNEKLGEWALRTVSLTAIMSAIGICIVVIFSIVSNNLEAGDDCAAKGGAFIQGQCVQLAR